MPTVPWEKARAEDHDCDQRASHQQQHEDNRPTADCQYGKQGKDHEEKDRRVLMLHDSASSAGIGQLDRVAVMDEPARDEGLLRHRSKVRTSCNRRSSHPNAAVVRTPPPSARSAPRGA
jgi:hypothetical protein